MYVQPYDEWLKMFASEDFLDLTLINITRSPLEVINSVYRRILGARQGIDSWRAIESFDDAIYEWKWAWNARKLLYSQIPFKRFVDLNYHALIHEPSSSSSKIAELIGISDDFDSSIISDDPIEWYLDDSQLGQISASFPSIFLRKDWQEFGLFLDGYDFCFRE